MRAERLFNIALGASIAGWSIQSFLNSTPSLKLYVLTGLNLLIASLIIFRRAESSKASLGQTLLAFPSLVVAALLVSLSLGTPWEQWSISAQSILLLGSAWTIASFLALGRSFAVLPSMREVVSRGPYRLIRHPAYLGEFVIISGFAIATGTWLSLGLLAGLLPLLALRIGAEERLLMKHESYANYAKQSRWRLVPGLW
jgi:protein-S-isoprenylcysteine O-methyltransferase Ste14